MPCIDVWLFFFPCATCCDARAMPHRPETQSRDVNYSSLGTFPMPHWKCKHCRGFAYAHRMALQSRIAYSWAAQFRDRFACVVACAAYSL
ncbi:BgTH12-07114 [Blumeria graminis f. sp. triticale]|uniref:BgTH12-07114 n=1 Tax=Blumeria graminis f. sp. triticale TaxID=1689686 RepID=A0A9W4GI05_BLUGR|nr:BgTH12-07114 [Blumeria graminis f. sp. triticale]